MNTLKKYMGEGLNFIWIAVKQKGLGRILLLYWLTLVGIRSLIDCQAHIVIQGGRELDHIAE